MNEPVMTRDELIMGLENLAETIKEDYPAIGATLYLIGMSLHANAENDLFKCVFDFSTRLKEGIEKEMEDARAKT